MHRGFVKVWRKVEDSGLCDDMEALGFATALILDANWKDKKAIVNKKVVEVKRGQLIFGRKTYANRFNVSERKIRTLMDLLENIEFLTRKPTNKFTIVTICNYSKYQDDPSKTGQQHAGHSGQQTTNKRPTKDQQETTSKEGKEGKEGKERKEGIEAKRDVFAKSIYDNVNKYHAEMLRAFFRYWSEPTQDKKRMRWELQKTWSLGGRLATWAARQKESARPESGVNTKAQNNYYTPPDEGPVATGKEIEDELKKLKTGG